MVGGKDPEITDDVEVLKMEANTSCSIPQMIKSYPHRIREAVGSFVNGR